MSANGINSIGKGHNGNSHEAHVSSNGKRKVSKASSRDSSSDDDQPLVKKVKTSNGSGNANTTSTVLKRKASDDQTSKKRFVIKEEDDDNDASSDSDAPLGKPRASKTTIRKDKSKVVNTSEDSSDSDAPLTLSNGTTSRARNGKSGDSDEAEDSEEEESEEEDNDDEDDEGASPKKGRNQKIDHSGTGEVKWTTLYHTGPRFPPEYEPLPKSVKMKYDGTYQLALERLN